MSASAIRAAFEELVDQARNLVDVHDRHSGESLTLSERQELGVLWIRMEDFRDLERAARVASSRTLAPLEATVTPIHTPAGRQARSWWPGRKP